MFGDTTILLMNTLYRMVELMRTDIQQLKQNKTSSKKLVTAELNSRGRCH